MSTSILYHGFGVYGYKYVKTEYREGLLIFHIEKGKDFTIRFSLKIKFIIFYDLFIIIDLSVTNTIDGIFLINRFSFEHFLFDEGLVP